MDRTPLVDPEILSPAYSRLRESITSFLPAITPLTEQVRSTVSRFADLWQEQLNQQLSQTFELLKGIDFAGFYRAVTPPNLVGISYDLDDLIAVLVEGVAMYGVPRPSIAAEFITVPNPQARRHLLYARREPILDDCSAVADGLTDPDVRESGAFLSAAIAAVRAGHWEAGQALAANLLDTALSLHLDEPARNLFVHQWKNRKLNQPRVVDDLVDGLSYRHAVVAIPIWTSYVSYVPTSGKPVPKRFSRHGSAHTVSRPQYNKRNAIQAIMLAASLLFWIDEQLAESRT